MYLLKYSQVHVLTEAQSSTHVLTEAQSSTCTYWSTVKYMYSEDTQVQVHVLTELQSNTCTQRILKYKYMYKYMYLLKYSQVHVLRGYWSTSTSTCTYWSIVTCKYMYMYKSTFLISDTRMSTCKVFMWFHLFFYYFGRLKM